MAWSISIIVLRCAGGEALGDAEAFAQLDVDDGFGGSVRAAQKLVDAHFERVADQENCLDIRQIEA